MTSKFSIDNRDLLQRISSGEAVVGIDFGNLIVRELAAFRLAAMDSESWCLPLDYLQGHKDGLEWAAQLAEANHPETGDWLYDDPIELAKAIRKGTDMPPVQPVADREPDRNPVLAYADSYRDMAKQGVESVPIWSVITDLERNIAPLYRHAQPVPVVPYDFDFDRFNDVVWLECVASNPHMHSPTTSIIARVALELNKRILAGNSPVIPEGYVMVPKEPTEQMYDAGDRQMATKQVWDAMLAAAPQQHNAPQNIPEIIPGWIPVSERMPENDGAYLCWDNRYVTTYAFIFGAWQANQFVAKNITHWMPLPAAPQEPSLACISKRSQRLS
ncbi:DUF551 domain-containing protein [Klebsiella pneumoniae]|nr:DUF551 domain-containing protein [Klebsiella pneumoniae]URC06379.1 DUF551 domain-containing protein [Klebsiella pneumoniae]WJU49881.1 DUF551 domain-containing protein [Klebsiella pneumoniae]